MLDTREELEKVKSILIGKVRDQVGHRHIHGRPIVLDADGVPHRALFYPAQTPGVPVLFHCYPAVCHGFTEAEGPEQENGIRWLLDAICAMTEGV